MKKIISTENAPGAIGPYSQGVQAGNLLFISGQLPIDPKTSAFAGDDIVSQTKQSLTNIKAIAEAAGSTMDDVIKVNIFLKDMNHFAEMNGVYGEFFTSNYPARAAVEVARLPKDALIEIEAIVEVR